MDRTQEQIMQLWRRDAPCLVSVICATYNQEGYIRDCLGHVDLKTTEIYARTDTESKRKAIENAYSDIINSDMPDWSKDKELLSWRSDLK